MELGLEPQARALPTDWHNAVVPRQDFLHKLSARLVRDYDLITIEDLNIRGLARTKLSMSVLDAGWGMFRFMLAYKADRNNATLMLVDRFFASTCLCRACGIINADLTLADRHWICQCGAAHDRDWNAAKNIDHEGLRLYHLNVAAGSAETQNACGDWIRPTDRTAPIDEAGSPRASGRR